MSTKLPLICVVFLLLPSVGNAQKKTTTTVRVKKHMNTMIAEITKDLQRTAHQVGFSSFSPQVLQAISNTPRHLFVTQNTKHLAYQNHPLSIGHGQTISQPYIVALMTQIINPKPTFTVLEIGTGSGYQAAILSHLVKQVYTIEIVKPLGLIAQKRLKKLGYHNVEVKIGDGFYGWEQKGPFDAIIVTAAAKKMPMKLIEQMKPKAKMIIPMADSPASYQQLVVVTKGAKKHDYTRKNILAVRFVPFTGDIHKK